MRGAELLVARGAIRLAGWRGPAARVSPPCRGSGGGGVGGTATEGVGGHLLGARVGLRSLPRPAPPLTRALGGVGKRSRVHRTLGPRGGRVVTLSSASSESVQRRRHSFSARSSAASAAPRACARASACVRAAAATTA